eukprot:1616436-Rhodomonas_salina.1
MECSLIGLHLRRPPRAMILTSTTILKSDGRACIWASRGKRSGGRVGWRRLVPGSEGEVFGLGH